MLATCLSSNLSSNATFPWIFQQHYYDYSLQMFLDLKTLNHLLIKFQGKHLFSSAAISVPPRNPFHTGSHEALNITFFPTIKKKDVYFHKEVRVISKLGLTLCLQKNKQMFKHEVWSL